MRSSRRTPEPFDGYVKPDHILVRPEAWRRFCNGFDPTAIAQHLQQRGALIADNDEQLVESGAGDRQDRAVLRAVPASLTP